MAKVKDMTTDELGFFIEHKLLELLGDPDSGLRLKKEFRKKVEERIRKSSRRIPHEEALKRFA